MLGTSLSQRAHSERQGRCDDCEQLAGVWHLKSVAVDARKRVLLSEQVEDALTNWMC